MQMVLNHLWLTPLTACFMLIGCSKGFGSQTDTSDSDQSDTAPEWSEDKEGEECLNALPDLTADLDPTGCEEMSGEALSGARVYFYGEVVDAGDEWWGTERMLVFANDTWTAAGGADCEVVWNTTAIEGTTSACSSCNLGLAVSGVVDSTQTTCDADIYVGEETFEVSYDVMVSSGSTSWYYSASGTYMGAGYHEGDAINFLSDETCQWY